MNRAGDDQAPDAIAAALEYALLGLRTFPLAPQNKVPWHGLKRWQVRASNKPGEVRKLFLDRDGCNLAIATGGGLFVVDVDAGRSGFERSRSTARRPHAADDGDRNHGRRRTAFPVSG